MVQIKSKNQLNDPQNVLKDDKKLSKKKAPLKDSSIHKETNQIESFISKYGFASTLSIIIIISLIVFRDFVFLKSVFLFKDIGSDSINVDYPWAILNQNMKEEQGFFTWSFYSGLGYPVFSGVLTLINPSVITNLITVPLFDLLYGSNPAFLKFPYFLFTVIAIATISFFYFKTLNVSRLAQLTGSILIAFMGYSIACSSWNHYYDVLNGIFLLFAFEQLYKHNRWYFFPVAISFLTGNIFNVYIYGFFLITYMLFRFFSENNFEIKKLGLLTLKMAGLTILGLSLNAVNFAVNLTNAIDSPRVSGDVSILNEAAQNPMLSNIGYQLSTAFLRLFSSDMVGTADEFRGWYNYLEAPLFYCGIICMVLAFQVFSFLSKREKITYCSFIGFWLLVVLFPGLRHIIHFQLGEYYKVGINFFIPIVLIFFSMQALTRIEKENKINLPVLIISGIVLILLLFYPFKISNINMVDKDIKNWVVFFLIAYSTLFIFIKNVNFRRYFQIALIVLIVIEISYFSNISITSRKTYSAREFKQSEGGYKDNTLDAIKYIKSKDKSFFRFEKDYFSGNAMHASLNDAQTQRYFGTTLYSSFNQPYYIGFLSSVNIIQLGNETQTRWAPGLRSRPLLQTMASIKYNVSKSEKPFMLNAGYKSVEKFGDVTLMSNDYFIPFGFCYDSFISEKDFKSLSNLQKDIALLRCFVINEKNPDNDFIKKNFKEITANDTITNFDFTFYRNFVDQRRKDTLQISNFKHDKIAGTVDLDSSRMLFFSIPYDKNWKAKVDGKNTQPEIVNIGFIGIQLEKGKHTIELAYLPDYFYYALVITIISSLIYVILFFVTKEFKMKTKIVWLGIFLISYLLNYFLIWN